jgi:hypothetical protein
MAAAVAAADGGCVLLPGDVLGVCLPPLCCCWLLPPLLRRFLQEDEQ